jgi:TetR/AcrR family transcriptional regulator
MNTVARQPREKEQRRTSILRAAERVFADKGPELATMDDVAHAADLGKGTLYLYFDSKNALFLEIANRTLRELLEALKQSETGAETGYDRVARVLGTIASFGLAHPDRFQVAVSWTVSGEPSAADVEQFTEYRRLMGGVYDTLGAAVDAGKQDETIAAAADTPTLVVELLGALLGALLVEVNARQIARRLPALTHWDGLAGGVLRLVLGGIRSAEARPAGESGSARAAE